MSGNVPVLKRGLRQHLACLRERERMWLLRLRSSPGGEGKVKAPATEHRDGAEDHKAFPSLRECVPLSFSLAT